MSTDDRAPAQLHSLTSTAAGAELDRSGKASTLRRAVLEYLNACGAAGATDEEIQLALDMNPSTQRPRRIELVQRKLVRDSGLTRLTRSKRAAVVWVPTSNDPPQSGG